MNVLVGQRVRFIRKVNCCTIKQLSSETGLSIGYLSNLERGLNSPTIDQLQRICATFGVNVSDILSVNKVTSNPLVKARERSVLFDEEAHVKYEMLTEGSHDLEGICITLSEGTTYEKSSWMHSYDEIGVVFRGVMSISTLEGNYLMEEGDSLYISKKTLHTMRNAGEGECVSFWFYLKQADTDRS